MKGEKERKKQKQSNRQKTTNAAAMPLSRGNGLLAAAIFGTAMIFVVAQLHAPASDVVLEDASNAMASALKTCDCCGQQECGCCSSSSPQNINMGVGGEIHNRGGSIQIHNEIPPSAEAAPKLGEEDLMARKDAEINLLKQQLAKQQALRKSGKTGAKKASGPRSAKHTAAVVEAVKGPARETKHVISGRAIFARMVKVLGKVAKSQRDAKKAKTAPKPPADLPAYVHVVSSKGTAQHGSSTKAFKQALAMQSLMAEAQNEDGEIDMEEDPPANTVYVYRGRL
jgi:hypothetical protein